MPCPHDLETPTFAPRTFTMKGDLRWNNVLALGAYPWDDGDELDFSPDAEKAAGLADAALNLAVCYFPLLSESLWEALVDVHVSAPNLFRDVIGEATRNAEYLEYLTTLTPLAERMSDAEYDVLASIEPGAWLPIALAGNLYWSTRSPDLRSLLSHVSGRPHECVFVNDPKPEELWRVVRVDRVNDFTRHVVLAFGDDTESGFVDLKRKTCGTVHIDDLYFYFDRHCPRYYSLPGTNTFGSVAIPLAHATALKTYKDLSAEDIAAAKAALTRREKFLPYPPHFPE